MLSSPANPAMRPATASPPLRAGAHILSGNVLQPTALDELLPGWREDADCPIHRQPATASRFYYLTRRAALRLPNPPQMGHKGNYVISLRCGAAGSSRHCVAWAAVVLSSKIHKKKESQGTAACQPDSRQAEDRPVV